MSIELRLFAVLVCLFVALGFKKSSFGCKKSLFQHLAKNSPSEESKRANNEKGSLKEKPKHPTYERRPLPHSDLKVSPMGLGTMMMGDHVSQTDSIKLLDQATKEYGINLVDCAELNPAPYAESLYGHSDQIVGSWLKTQSSSFRDELVISAKLCGYSNDILWPRGGQKMRSTQEQVFEAVDRMLARLQTPYIDLLQFQWPERYTLQHGAT
eukprot:gene39099-47570_t